MGAVLKVAALRHRRAAREVLAIDRLELGPGERLAVLGPNGAGKTTLLRLLAGLEIPTEGSVEIDGLRMTAGDHELRRRIGFATQRAGLLSTSVQRNVELPLAWPGIERRARRRKASAALDRLGVAHLANRRAPSLSGGEAQRVNLARALALDPDLLLLDEPASGLDPEGRRRFLDDLEIALADRVATVVHVSHRADEALRLADRVAILVDGAVRQLGAPSSLIREPADGRVAALLGYENVIPARLRPDGEVEIGGRASGLRARGAAGPATLAVWATGVHVDEPGCHPLQAVVERVSPGPGRWDVVLSGDPPLRVHLPIHASPPAAGEQVAVRLDPDLAAVMPVA